MTRPVLYVAGPMTGLPEKNLPAFHAAEAALRAVGYEVINPARHDELSPGLDWLGYMRVSLADMLKADALAMLPGWHKSRGAGVEYDLAQGLGMRAHPLDLWLKSARPDGGP